jgi:hypothetical protein
MEANEPMVYALTAPKKKIQMEALAKDSLLKPCSFKLLTYRDESGNIPWGHSSVKRDRLNRRDAEIDARLTPLFLIDPCDGLITLSMIFTAGANVGLIVEFVIFTW